MLSSRTSATSWAIAPRSARSVGSNGARSRRSATVTRPTTVRSPARTSALISGCVDPSRRRPSTVTEVGRRPLPGGDHRPREIDLEEAPRRGGDRPERVGFVAVGERPAELREGRQDVGGGSPAASGRPGGARRVTIEGMAAPGRRGKRVVQVDPCAGLDRDCDREHDAQWCVGAPLDRWPSGPRTIGRGQDPGAADGASIRPRSGARRSSSRGRRRSTPAARRRGRRASRSGRR